MRRRRRMWSWDAIKAHRDLCAMYRDLYKTKLLTKKPSSQLLADLEVCVYVCVCDGVCVCVSVCVFVVSSHSLQPCPCSPMVKPLGRHVQ